MKNNEMKNKRSMSLPALAFEGGTKAITLTPVVGTPRREYAEEFIPGEETLADGEMRVTVLGSGNPWPTRAQASASILVEVGNPERDLLVFDLGTGSLANYASLKLPVNKLNKVFLTHLHADHMGDLITLSGSFAKVGRADGPVSVWGPSGTEPRLGTRHFAEARKELIKDGWKHVSKIFIIAVVLDIVYQLKVFHKIYPGEILLVAIILAIFPYLLLRGPANRLMRFFTK